MHILRWSVVALTLPFVILSAQEAPVLQSGARVRVRNDEHLHNVRVVGTLESIDTAAITVRRESGELVRIPRQLGTRLEVSAGPGLCGPNNRGDCAAIGLFGGVGIGALAGAIWVHSQGRDCIDNACGLIYVLTVPLGAFVGVIVGATVGGEHWHPADLPGRLSLGPDGWGRFDIGASVRF